MITISIVLAVLELRLHPWKILPVLVILHILFFFWPFFDFILGFNKLEYSYFSYFGLKATVTDAKFYLLVSSLSVFIISLTSYFNVVYKLRKNFIYNGYVWHSNIKVLFVLLFVCCLVLLASRNFSGEWFVFFSPARKDLNISGYERKLLFVAPCLLLYFVRFSRFYTIRNFILIVLFSIMVVAILGQRRDIAALLLYSFLLIKYDSLSNLKFSRKFQVRAGLFFVTLIPSLWYARSFFTQLGRGGEIINPLTLRGPLELIFGSSTTGFASFFLQQRHLDSGAIETLHSIKQILGVAIPRSIYPDKLSTIPQVIKLEENDIGNISNFFVNEMFMNFFGLFPIFIFVFSVAMNTFYKYAKDQGGFLSGTYLFCFANVILLFKNGWSDYLITVVMFAILIKLFNIEKYIFLLFKTLSYNGMGHK